MSTRENIRLIARTPFLASLCSCGDNRFDRNPEDRFSRTEAQFIFIIYCPDCLFRLLKYIFVNNLDPDQARQNVEPNLALISLITLILERKKSADDKYHEYNSSMQIVNLHFKYPRACLFSLLI